MQCSDWHHVFLVGFSPYLDHFNGMLIGLIKVSALAGDNFQSLIICGGMILAPKRVVTFRCSGKLRDRINP